MTDQEQISPHAGSYYRETWSIDYILWSLVNFPSRINPTILMAGALPGTIPGIDLSHWQGDLGLTWWQNAYVEGYRFVFLKATDGLSFVDPKFAVNKENAKQAGFKVGAYHFARPQEGGREQAEVFIQTAGELDLGGVWDLEVAGGVSDVVVNQRSEQFLEVLNDHYGFSWMYSAAWFLDPRQINPQVPYYRWVAHWTNGTTPYLPRIWRDREYDAWQYSSTETVSGKYPIDANRMQKSLFDKLIGDEEQLVTLRVKPETVEDLQRALDELAR
jgi:GH25 family lysozyme M1 (1,4-beta-N-acetylmuramidase)